MHGVRRQIGPARPAQRTERVDLRPGELLLVAQRLEHSVTDQSRQVDDPFDPVLEADLDPMSVPDLEPAFPG